jgi:hypothetical protein
VSTCQSTTSAITSRMGPARLGPAAPVAGGGCFLRGVVGVG